jgi:hypothetical protein
MLALRAGRPSPSQWSGPSLQPDRHLFLREWLSLSVRKGWLVCLPTFLLWGPPSGQQRPADRVCPRELTAHGATGIGTSGTTRGIGPTTGMFGRLRIHSGNFSHQLFESVLVPDSFADVSADPWSRLLRVHHVTTPWYPMKPPVLPASAAAPFKASTRDVACHEEGTTLS